MEKEIDFMQGTEFDTSAEASSRETMWAESRTDSQDWGASFRQNVVGLRSMQVEHKDRNAFSTFVQVVRYVSQHCVYINLLQR